MTTLSNAPQNSTPTIKKAEDASVVNPQVKKVTPAEAPPVQKARAAVPVFTIRTPTQERRYLNVLVYGDYGVGKSTLAATASEVPEYHKVLYINAEAGDESIKDYDIDIVDIVDFSQFARVHEYLRRHCTFRDAYVKNKDVEARKKLIYYEALLKQVPEESIQEPTLYYTVAIDTLSEVQKYCMYQLLGIKVGEWALDLAPDAPQWEEWGKAAEMIRLLVRSFRDLPIHTFMVCGRAQEQDQTKRYHYDPLLPGKLSNEIQGFFDVVGYLVSAPTEGGEMHRRLWLEPGQTFKAKNRFRNFDGRYIDNPTVADLAKLSMLPKK